MEPPVRDMAGMGGAPFGGIPTSVIVITVVAIALVSTIIFLIVRNAKMKKDVLKERLVKGEINEQEYKNLLTLLKNS